MLRFGWWKQDGNRGHVMPRESIGRRNVIRWDNPAAELAGSSLAVAEPPPHPGSLHAGPRFAPKGAAVLFSLSPSCIPCVVEML